jgi:uncharacterized protein (TIGR02302 family)
MAEQDQTAAPGADIPEPTPKSLRQNFNAVVRRARLAGTWESAWPRLLPSVSVTALFLSSAASGAWHYLPAEGRMAGLAAFGVALLVSLVPLKNIRVMSRKDAIARIDANTGKKHRPAETLIIGEPTDTNPQSESHKLWVAHKYETAKAIQELRAGRPRPDMTKHDPYKLRYGMLFLALAGALAGNIHAPDNMKQPFDWTRPPPVIVPARVDTWVTPPEYTRQAPVFLTIDGKERPDIASGSEMDLPTGSTMTIRVTGGDSTVSVTGGATIEREPPPLPTAEELKDATPAQREAVRKTVREYELRMTGDATVEINAYGGVVLRWTFDVTPDTAPRVDIQTGPSQRRPGATELQYTVQDDYGGVTLTPHIVPGTPPQSGSKRPPRPLVEPPKINLPPPR